MIGIGGGRDDAAAVVIIGGIVCNVVAIATTIVMMVSVLKQDNAHGNECRGHPFAAGIQTLLSWFALLWLAIIGIAIVVVGIVVAPDPTIPRRNHGHDVSHEHDWQQLARFDEDLHGVGDQRNGLVAADHGGHVTKSRGEECGVG